MESADGVGVDGALRVVDEDAAQQQRQDKLHQKDRSWTLANALRFLFDAVIVCQNDNGPKILIENSLFWLCLVDKDIKYEKNELTPQVPP